MKTAVGAVAIPHVIATALRFWRVRSEVDWRIFFGFGLTNAPGSLAGALIHVWVDNPILARVLGILLVFAGLIGVVLGTLAGDRLLRRIPEKLFRRVVSSILLAIGIYLLATSPWTG